MLTKPALANSTYVGIKGGNLRQRSRMSRYANSLAAAGSRLVLCGRPLLGPTSPDGHCGTRCYKKTWTGSREIPEGELHHGPEDTIDLRPAEQAEI